MKNFILFFLIILTFRSSLAKNATKANRVTYEEKSVPLVGSIRLYPEQSTYDEKTLAPFLSLQQTEKLVLEFDIFSYDAENYSVRLIHCNANWERSSLREMEYLDQYNEFSINEFDYSFNTLVDYVHYTFELPKVKVSGNYILEVFPEGDEKKTLFSRRFIVFEEQVGIYNKIEHSSNITTRRQIQKLKLEIDYSSLHATKPDSQIKIILRQNQRWDNAIVNLKPSFINEHQKRLEYNYYNSETDFKGGNEFRFFDLRSLNFPGQNVAKILKKNNTPEAHLFMNKTRANEVYRNYEDINGQYVINNIDKTNSELESEYVNVLFTLKAEEELHDDVYILGALNDWQVSNKNKMSYDRERKLYKGQLNLKQGWYNYIYWVDNPEKSYFFENSYFETENQYEIIVYFRSPKEKADRVVGYKSFTANSQRN